jgi:ATP-dependent RNA helicase RhlE
MTNTNKAKASFSKRGSEKSSPRASSAARSPRSSASSSPRAGSDAPRTRTTSYSSSAPIRPGSSTKTYSSDRPSYSSPRSSSSGYSSAPRSSGSSYAPRPSSAPRSSGYSSDRGSDRSGGSSYSSGRSNYSGGSSYSGGGSSGGSFRSSASRFSSGGSRSSSGGSYSSDRGGYSSGGYSSGGDRGGYSSRPSYGGSSRPSYGGSSYGGGSRGFSGGGRGYGGGRSSGGRGRGGFKGSSIDVSKYINKNVVTEKEIAYVPTHTFADFNITEELKASIVAKGYVNPTPIQDKSIPVVLEGSDVVGIANTGTGKTMAFLIPLINKILLNKQESVLIMAPTRELAQQISDELYKLSRGFGIHAGCYVGGTPIRQQFRSLHTHNHFVIGTPGRLKDLVDRKALNLSGFKNIVLDEADRMLDMGFIDDMKYLMARMPADRQTLFFSATMSPEIERLVSSFLKNPAMISVKTRSTSANVEQDVVRVKHPATKIETLHDLLSQEDFERVIVFGKTKHGVEKLHESLKDKGHRSVSIHGDKNQYQRQRAITDFKTDKVNILVATDVAARGLDIPNVSHVINYDLPSTHDDYVHRIGRTGRANTKGKALTFID